MRRDNSEHAASIANYVAGLLAFHTPRGLQLNASALSAPNFASSYNVGAVGVVDGSLSYAYSSIPLEAASKSGEIDLHHIIKGYRHLEVLRRPDEPWWWEVWERGKRIDRRGTTLVVSM